MDMKVDTWSMSVSVTFVTFEPCLEAVSVFWGLMKLQIRQCVTENVTSSPDETCVSVSHRAGTRCTVWFVQTFLRWSFPCNLNRLGSIEDVGWGPASLLGAAALLQHDSVFLFPLRWELLVEDFEGD